MVNFGTPCIEILENACNVYNVRMNNLQLHNYRNGKVTTLNAPIVLDKEQRGFSHYYFYISIILHHSPTQYLITQLEKLLQYY